MTLLVAGLDVLVGLGGVDHVGADALDERVRRFARRAGEGEWWRMATLARR
jgi:hypothetical protein